MKTNFKVLSLALGKPCVTDHQYMDNKVEQIQTDFFLLKCGCIFRKLPHN